MEEKLQDNSEDMKQLHSKETELLCMNREISESIVVLQNEICLLKSKVCLCNESLLKTIVVFCSCLSVVITDF